VRNEGIAFGLLHSFDSGWKPVILSVIALVAVAVVSYYIYHTPQEYRFSLISLGLLLGGILGNFTDRLANRYVTDFLTLHWKDQFAWPTFNVADAAISTGVFVILLQTVFARGDQKGLASLLLLPALGFGFGAVDPEKIIDRLQQQYEEMGSFTANFEQTFMGHGVTLRESGIVMMQKPGKMYWEYRDPTEKYFVADGKKTYFYVPKDRQMLVSDLNLSESNSPLLFLLGRGDIRRDFDASLEEVSREERSTDPIILRLTPRQLQPDFSYLILEISPVTFLIHRLTVVEPIGQQNDYQLSDIQENVKIPDQQFELKVPSDVEVVQE
jgi:lipoprotein signal peptidase/chaperone LolA